MGLSLRRGMVGLVHFGRGVWEMVSLWGVQNWLFSVGTFVLRYYFFDN